MKAPALLLFGLTLLAATRSQCAPAAHITLQPVTGDGAAGAAILVTQRSAAAGPIRHRVPVSTAGGGFGLRSSAAGIFGLAAPLFPATGGSRRTLVDLDWDLQALGPDAAAATSLDDLSGSPNWDQFAGAYLMAGSLHHYPAVGDFDAFWLEPPPFDAVLAIDWARKLRDYALQFFRMNTPPPYRIFLIPGPTTPRTLRLVQGLVTSFDAGTRVTDLETTLAHELLRPLSPRLQSDGTDWFTDGLALFYQRLLPVRAHLAPVRRFLEELDQSANRYYTNPLIGASNGEVGAHAADPRLRALAGDRGSFYLSLLNAKIRTVSGGRRSLDDVIAALIERGRGGGSMDASAFIELASREIGNEARTDYQSMLGGSVMLPESDAFGPCFERTSVRLRRFDPGFDVRSLMRLPHIVRGVTADSTAAHAGLRDGDEILGAVDLDALEDNPDSVLTLSVRRGGVDSTITYVPRGETVQAYQWRRINVVPDEACRL